ncbi:MAG: nucleotide sugar dehydrogenase [Planctomycetes bacterium]|nr:nucleotide sugar dehydrogenase [Planctomycetota bacterium]MCB9903219.1 nucleotide sugar dehydrogenase [Planctomycetota bacterium]
MRTEEPPPHETAVALRTALAEKRASVGVIGLGYVGLPLAYALHGAGLRVVGFDTDAQKVEALAEGRNYLKHLGEALGAELAESARFEATTDFARLGEVDAVLVCVPTPLGSAREPDLSFVLSTAHSIGRALRAGQLLVLESTTYPGTTRDEFLPAVLEAALAAGKSLEPGVDFFVAYSPERADPGRTTHSTATIPKVVGGLDATSGELAGELYRTCVEDVRVVTNAEVAEASKLLENVFRAVNIALVNELKVVLERLDINVWEVVEAASTKPFGFMPFYPGPGLGGHCIPIDPFYLAWKAKQVGQPSRFVELAGEINTEMPDYVIGRTVQTLENAGVALRDARVLVLGLAYKPDVDDTRESPSFELIAGLAALGAHVDYSDPHIPRTVPTRKHDLRRESVALDADSIRSYDAVLIATAHRAFDYELLAEHAALIVDTRNAMAGFKDRLGSRLVRA